MEIRAIHYATGQAVAIRTEGGTIVAVESIGSGGEHLPLIGPGLVDLQINGYAGLDLNAMPLAPQTVAQMVRELWARGVTACYPTIITNSDESITQAMAAIAAACDEDAEAAGGIAGIHLEGPFISPDDGARGAHAKEHVRPPDWALFRRWQDASGGRIRIMTLSPEWPGSAAFIERATAGSVIVSIGHTAATPAQVGNAVRAGARMSTHLGNAAHLMLPRHPNYLWEQLAADELWACVIADGFHLPDAVMKVVMRVKGERAMIVSDAVSLAGMPPGEYEMPVGGRVVLTPAGRLHLAANERLLAGSAQMLTDGIGHLTSSGLASLTEAWEMASLRPAKFMGLASAAGIAVSAPADLVLFDRDDAGGKLRVVATIKAGRRVWGAIE